MKRVLFLICLLSICFSYSPAFAAEDHDDHNINLDNGTLYNRNIHHRRPAKNIDEKFDEIFEKSVEESLSFKLSSDFLSRYTFQGMASSDGWVWQPSAGVELYGFGFNVWGNFVLGNIPDQGKINEIDLTFYYNMKFGNLTIQPYILTCLYPTNNKLSLDYSAYTDVEPSLHLAYTLGPIDLYVDFTAYAHPKPGAIFMDVGIGTQQKIFKRLGIETAAQFGFANSKFNRHAYGVSKNKIDFFEYTLSINWNPIMGFVVSPNANVSALLSADLRNAVTTPVLVWGGVDFTYNF